MNHCFLDWNLDDDLLLTNQNKLLEPENELVELLWRNGQVVLNSQNQRKVPTINHNEGRPFCGGSSGVSSNLIHNDETAPWIQDPSEDSFEKEFCSHFLSEFSQDPIEPIKPPIKPFGDGGTINRVVKFGAFDPSNRVMPPPKFQGSENNFGKMIDFSHTEAIKCSETTAGSSHCGSNHVPNKTGVGRASKRVVGDSTGLSTGPVSNDDSKVVSLSEKQRMEVFEPARTSSSGGSGGSFGKACEQSNGDNNTNKKKKKNSNSNSNSCKRKGRHAEESECQSETAEFESSPGKKPAQRSQGSSRRSRAAEVHNLSERRRRDRINEKMKALQELIPHCNKTDKASMLDEAIEYLKSLQLQLQVMWMGSGYAAPMMFQPAYMPHMGIGGMTSPPMPSILHHAMHLQRVPLVVDQPATSATAHPSTNTLNPSMMCRTPVLNPVNYQSQMMQNMPFPEQYARFMGFQHVQAASQPMNVFRYGQPATQQSQSQTTAIPPSTSGQPFNPGQPGADDTVGGKSG